MIDLRYLRSVDFCWSPIGRYGRQDMWTEAARAALGLSEGETRYDPRESREGVLPNGMLVRMLPSKRLRPSSRRGGLLRIQVLCPCGRWVPAGRMGQHLPPMHLRLCRRHTDCRAHDPLALECWTEQHLRPKRRRRS